MALDSNSEDHLFGFNDAQFSDRVLILVEGDEEISQECDRVHVSSMLLCARSEYFRKLFGKSFAENVSKEVVLKLEKDEKNVVMDILKFVYSMMCNFKLQVDILKDKSTDQIVRLSIVADRYLFPDVVEACMHVLLDRDLSVEQCVGLCKVMNPSNHEKLVAKIATVMDKVFEEHETKLHDPALTDLNYEIFRIMISSDTLNLYSENSVWAAVVCWSKKNKPSDDVLISILECVRLEHMDVGYLMNFVSPSPHWRHIGALSKLLGMSLARREISDEFLMEYDQPKRRNRSVKNVSTIKIEFDVNFAQVRERGFRGPKFWVSGVPFIAGFVYVPDCLEQFKVIFQSLCDTLLDVEDYVIGVKKNVFVD
eukprot:209887_1